MGTLRYSVRIAAAPGVVWAVLTDLARIPEWQTGGPRVSDVTGPGDQAGTAYTVRRGPGAARTTILEAEPPRRYVSRTEAYLGLRFELT